MPPYAMALVHAGLGDRDAVFAWLDKAYAERDVHLMYLPVESNGIRTEPIPGSSSSSPVVASRNEADPTP